MDWSGLATLNYVLGFLGPYRCAKLVCWRWYRCKGICPVLKMYYKCCKEEFIWMLESVETMRVERLDFRGCCYVDDTWLTMEKFVGMKNMREICLENCKIRDGGGIWKSMRSLRKISLHFCRWMDGVEVLNELVELTLLEELDLGMCRWVTNANLIFLRNMKRLRKLSLRGCENIGGGSGELNVLMEMKKLEDLDLGWCALMMNDDMKCVGKLLRIRRLGLSGCKGINDVGFNQLANLVELRELDLGSCRISSEGVQGLSGLVKIRTMILQLCERIIGSIDLSFAKELEELDLDWCEGICGIVLNEGVKLRKLKMRGCDIKNFDKLPDSLEELCVKRREFVRGEGVKGIGGLKGLLNLYVGCCDINDEDFGGLVLTRLREINLDSIPMTSFRARVLGELGELRNLSVACCKGVDGQWLREGVGKLVLLESLNLNGCGGVTDEALRELNGLKSLRKLNLSNCMCITDEGIRELLNLYMLEELCLDWCRNITNNGVRILSELRGLRWLDLCGCDGITDAAAVNELLKLVLLERLSLQCTGILSSELGGFDRLKHLRYLYSSY